MKKWLLLTFLLSFLHTAVEAAVIYLKDGSRLRGTVVGATAQNIIVHTADGILTITNDRLRRIDYEETAIEVPPAAAVVAPVPAQREVITPAEYNRRLHREGR